MEGKIKRPSKLHIRICLLAISCPCASHDLNLIDIDNVERCRRTITFLGMNQSLLNFKSSLQRWKMFKIKVMPNGLNMYTQPYAKTLEEPKT